MNTKSKNIHYNYYPIECTNVVNVVNNDTKLKRISSSFRGKINNPNIIYKKNNLQINYQATNFYINDRIHDMKESQQDGEIVILHQPTTTAMKLYVCFPFIESSKTLKTDIDKLIDSESNSLSKVYQDLPLSIEMNRYIRENPSVSEYQTIDMFGEQCLVIFFDCMIKINQHLEGNNLETALFRVSLEKPVVSVVEDKLKSPSILMEGFHESLMSARQMEDSFRKNKVDNDRSRRIETTIVDYLRKTPILSADEMLKKFKDEKSNEKISEKSNEKSNEKIDTNVVKMTSVMNNSKVDDNSSEVIYKCEYLPVDTDDMVQVLQVPVGSTGFNKGIENQVSGVFVSNTIFIFFVLAIFFISPLLYGFLESLLKSRAFLENLVFIKTHLNMDVNLLNLILISIVAILTTFLLIYGFSLNDGVAILFGIFVPFCAVISYIGIMFFKKTSSQNVI